MEYTRDSSNCLGFKDLFLLVFMFVGIMGKVVVNLPSFFLSGDFEKYIKNKFM